VLFSSSLTALTLRRASAENQPVYKNHLHTSRNSADEHELEVLDSILDMIPLIRGRVSRSSREGRWTAAGDE
jgi:hypothetical protein